MTEHTPGPWRIPSPVSGFSAIYGPNGELVFGLAAGSGDESQDDATCEANAALIARAPDLLTEVTRLRAVNAELVEALTEAESVFALAEQPRGKDRDHGPEVTEIGRRIGFGALMTSAQASWREYATERGHAGSEFVAGPCYSTVLSTLNMIRAALRAAEEASK